MTYDIQNIKAPRLAGTSLHLFTLALEGPLGAVLLPKLLADAGVKHFRSRLLDDTPTVAPPAPVVGTIASTDIPAPDLSALAEADHPGRPGFQFETVSDLAAAFRAGTADPVAVAEQVLAAVAESEAGSPALRTFIAQDADDVRAQATASKARFESGAPLGPLDGVPVAVKDELDQLPYPTTVGTRFKHTPATSDATVVARLRAAGAVLIGKTNMHEIGIGVTGLNPHHGTARNPYDPAHHTGGSSSGPAAAVAAGFCPLAVGADGGGSIRTPAAFCGVVGLKATWGRVSEHGAAPLVWSMGHVGPIAATARDCAIGYAVMAGPDEHDHRTLIQPPPTLDEVENSDLTGVRIGVFAPWFDDAEDEVVGACRATLDRLKGAGAQIIDIEIPELELARIAHVVTITSEMAIGTESDYAAHRRDYGLDVRINLRLARSFTSRDYVKAQQARARCTAIIEALFEQVDAIATPTTGCPAPRIKADALRKGESDLVTLGRIMKYVFVANLTGHPAISFPAGYTDAGLPIGFMAMSRHWNEALLLRLAHASELALERRPPQRHWSLL